MSAKASARPRITIRQGDLTRVEADAGVNPANTRGIMGGGVALALKRAGGAQIEVEARAQAPLALGQAVVTTGGALPCRHVIHAPTVVTPGGRSSADAVRKGTAAALRAAEACGLRRIAFPGMGTGVGRVSHAEAANAMLEAIASVTHASFDEILLVDRDPAMVKAWQDALGAQGWTGRRPIQRRTGSQGGS